MTIEIPMNLNNQLRLYIDELDTNVTRLAKEAGIPRQTLSDWLDGVPPKNFEAVKKIADVLAVSVDHLVFGEGLEPETAAKLSDYRDEILCGQFEVILRRAKK